MTGPTAGAQCASHAENPAHNVCERCGDFMCRLCTMPVDGRLYCPRCVDLLQARGSLQQDFYLPIVSFWLGVGALGTGVFCFGIPFGAPFALAGIWTGARALREISRRPDLPGRRLAWWGIVLSALSLPMVAVWLLFAPAM